MKKEYAFTIILLIALWQLAAMKVNNDILVPFPMEVLKYFIFLFGDKSFYSNVFATVVRGLTGFVISFVLALVMTVIAGRFTVVRNIFEPVQVLAKAIPNISYIVITLVWLGSEKSVSVIYFLIVFPVFYSNFIHALDEEPQEIKDIERIFPESFWVITWAKTLPSLMPVILTSGKMAFGLGFKVSVMAEILGQVKTGIGRQLYLARQNLDTTGLFAWTVVIILICFIVDWFFNRLIKIKDME